MVGNSKYTAFSSGKIRVDAKFSTFTEVKAAIFNLERSTSSKYYLQEAHRISALKSEVRNHIDQKLIYYEVTYACIRGRKKYEKERDKSKRKYSCKDCPASVRLRISHNGKYLQVKSCNLEHNHELLKFQINMLNKNKKVATKKNQKTNLDIGRKEDATIDLETIQEDLRNIQAKSTNSARKECPVKQVGNNLHTYEVTIAHNQSKKTTESIENGLENSKNKNLNDDKKGNNLPATEVTSVHNQSKKSTTESIENDLGKAISKKDKKDVKPIARVQNNHYIKRMCDVITMKRYMSNKIAEIKEEKTENHSEYEEETDQIVALRNSLEKMKKEYKCQVGEKNRQITMAEDLISDLNAELNVSASDSTSKIGEDAEISSSKKDVHVNILVIQALEENIERYKREAKEKNKQIARTESQIQTLNSLIEESSVIKEAKEAIQSDLSEINSKKFSLETEKLKRSREDDDDDDSSEEVTKKRKEGDVSSCSSDLSDICESSESDSNIDSDSTSNDTAIPGTSQAHLGLTPNQEGTKKYKCNGCNKHFNHAKSLDKHKLRHPHIKTECNHKCHLCNFATNDHSNLQAHLSMHSDEPHSKKIYTCSICQKSFNHVTELHKHKRANHYKTKPFSCKVCGKAFAKNNDRRKHEKVHTEYRPHTCQYCCRGFQELSYLKEHVIQWHTHKYPYNCHLCDKGFLKPFQWRTHVAKVHPED